MFNIYDKELKRLFYKEQYDLKDLVSRIDTNCSFNLFEDKRFELVEVDAKNKYQKVKDIPKDIQLLIDNIKSGKRRKQIDSLLEQFYKGDKIIPSDKDRQLCIIHPLTSYIYALTIDKQKRADTQAACQTSYEDLINGKNWYGKAYIQYVGTY